MKRVLFIVNPRSGKGSIKYHILDILDTFSKKGIDVTVHITQERLDACRTAMEEGGNYDEIVLSGGDGTLDEVVSGLMKGGHDTPVGYIPAGSTNDFASSLKLPVRMGDAAKIAVSGAPRRLMWALLTTSILFISRLSAFLQMWHIRPARRRRTCSAIWLTFWREPSGSLISEATI